MEPANEVRITKSQQVLVDGISIPSVLQCDISMVPGEETAVVLRVYACKITILGYAAHECSQPHGRRESKIFLWQKTEVYNNYNTVSIEIVSHTDSTGRYYIPEETIHNASRLYQMLLKKLPNVEAAVRHYDISMKLCPLPLIDEGKWSEFKKLLVEVDEVVEKSKIIVDGEEHVVERILKDGTNYVKVRDLAAALDLEVSNKGNIAVLTTKA